MLITKEFDFVSKTKLSLNFKVSPVALVELVALYYVLKGRSGDAFIINAN